jgi:hypothetical protein
MPNSTMLKCTIRLRFLGAAAILTLALAGGTSVSFSQQDKYAAVVPGGLAFAEFRGYESWPVVAISRNDRLISVIVANPTMINAYLAGVPENGQSFPDGAKMAKVHWVPKQSVFFPDTTVPGAQHDVDFMVKDSKRFADSGGWGWAAFNLNPSTQTFEPATADSQPPQANDAKCGFSCHTIAEKRDYVFTEYGRR